MQGYNSSPPRIGRVAPGIVGRAMGNRKPQKASRNRSAMSKGRGKGGKR